MNEKKRRLIDDDVVVSLIYDFEVEEWRNGIMEEGMCAEFKGYYSDHSVNRNPRFPVLDLANKTALPKTPQP